MILGALDKLIYYFLLQKLTRFHRKGFLAWVARIFNHPYGWESLLTDSEIEALNKLAVELGITENE